MINPTLLKVHKSLDFFSDIKNPVVTIGTFDGVHLGHQKLIKKLNKNAAKVNGETVLFTFYPHPRMVLFPDDHGLKLINTIEEKLSLLDQAGLDHVILYPFSRDFSRISAIHYVRDILVNKIGVHTLIVGYDHHFGRNREGNFQLLKELSEVYDFNVKKISALEIEEINVSSTKIRKQVTAGNVKLANTYLGYEYCFSGTVVPGKQKGREIGYRTANIKIADEVKLLPEAGVFACKAIVNGKKQNGMVNIGNNPTFNRSSEVRIEVHLLDFTQDIYGEDITILLVEKLRNEKQFDSKEQLIVQLKHDELKTREILN